MECTHCLCSVLCAQATAWIGKGTSASGWHQYQVCYQYFKAISVSQLSVSIGECDPKC